MRGDIWHELLSIAAGAKIEGLCKFAENPRDITGAKLSVVASSDAVEAVVEKTTKAIKTSSGSDIGALPGLARATS